MNQEDHTDQQTNEIDIKPTNNSSISNVIKIGVYEIKFPGGEFYIGSAFGIKGIFGRWKNHKSGYKNSPKYLQTTAQKYGGWDNAQFIILKETNTKEEALLFEQEYIDKFWNDDFRNSLLLNKNRNVMRAPDLSGKNHPNFGKHPTEETRRKMSKSGIGNKSRFGIPHTKETKEEMSKSRSGEKGSNAKLSPIEVKEIRTKYNSGNYTQTQLAVEYNVVRTAITKIINNKTWKE